jgi:hypothetical protein
LPRSHPQEDGLADACSKVPLLAKNLKMVALRTQTPLRDKEQWRYTCAHPERDEAVDSERQRRRCDKEGTTPRRAFGGLTGFICTEVRKFSRRCTFGELGSLTLAAMYLRRTRVVCRSIAPSAPPLAQVSTALCLRHNNSAWTSGGLARGRHVAACTGA